MKQAPLKLTATDAKSHTIPDDRRIYAADDSVTSVFSDDFWDLSPSEIASRSQGVLQFDFSYISHNKPLLKLAAKELIFYRLNVKLSSAVKKLAPYTAVREQVRLKRFIRWLHSYHPDVTCFSQITQAIVHAYRKWLERHAPEDALEDVAGGRYRGKSNNAESVSAETVWSYMSPLKAYDLYQGFFTFPMGFSPYGGKLSARFVGVEPKITRENSTPVISDDVLHPLIKVSGRYLDYYLPDIKAMCADRLSYWTEKDNGSKGPASWRTTISQCPELGEPWRPPLGSEGYHINHEFRAEMGHFISACSAIILYLSGMRPYEICALKTDCLKAVIDPITGEVVRWRVRGIPAKKRGAKNKARPKLVTWVVPELAARAIKALQEILEPFRQRIKTDRLILNLDAFMHKVDRTDVNKPGMDERSLGLRLKEFLATITDRYGYEIINDVMPSQFRKTLARHIARQPYGILAGKLQYHHVKTTVFEGYAGSSNDGFRLDVADEELLANIDFLEEMRQDQRDGCLLGPGAIALVRDYDAAKAADIGEAMVDTSPGGIAVGSALKALAKRVHVGALNYCVFDTAKALCLTPEERVADDAEPKLNMCSPDRCGSSVVGDCHKPVWQSLLDDVDELKKQAKNKLQKESLDLQAQRYKRVIDTRVAA